MKKLHTLIHSLFIPSGQNNFRARVLHNDTLTVYLVILFIVAFVFKFTSLGNSQILGVATNINIQKLLDDTNNERKKNGLPELKYSAKLAQAAQYKAQDMFTNSYWAHYSPQGKTPWDFLLKAEYKYEYAGENLAKNFMFSDQVVSAWMNSPTHRENIMRREFTHVGFAIQNGSLEGDETTLVVQMFAKPLPTELGSEPDPITIDPAPATGVLAESTQRLAIPKLPLYATYMFIGLLIAALVADLFAISRIDVTRLHGKNAAHLIFLVTILIGIAFFITKGVIL